MEDAPLKYECLEMSRMWDLQCGFPWTEVSLLYWWGSMIPAVILNWTWLKASACSVLLLLYCPSLLTWHYPPWQQQHTVIHFFCSCCHDIKRQSPLHIQEYPVFGIVCGRWCDPTQTSSCFVLLLLFSYADIDEWLNRWTHGSNLRSYLRPRFVLISRPVRSELPRNPAALPFLSAEAF